MLKPIALYLLLVCPLFSAGQTILHIKSSDQGVYPDLRKKIVDSRNPGQILSEIQQTLLNSGFLASGFDSVNISKDSIYAELYVGEQYKFATLTNENIDESILAGSGFRDRLYLGKPLNLSQIKRLHQRILNGYEQNGYPFARVRLTIDSIEGNKVNARLIANPMQLFVIDSIIIKSEQHLSRHYVTHAIGIKQGEPYNQKLLDEISTRIKEISFVSEIKPAELVFKEGKTDVYLYLKKKVANRFNGVLGVLPDNTTGKITFTGEAKLDLVNALNSGEELHFSWRKLQTFTQELDLSGGYPFIFGLPLGIGAEFNLYKKDTTYIEINPTLEIRYQLEGTNSFSLFFNSYQSNLLNPDLFAASVKLPAFNDTRRTLLGFRLRQYKLDYRLNPRRGYFVDAKAGTGYKKIKVLKELNPEVYDGIKLTASQHQIEGKTGYFLPLFRRTTLLAQVYGGWLISENLFINEMKRLGGISSLRGFDDQSILASAFVVGTLEYRLLLEQNSYLYGFVDYGYYENRSSDGFVHAEPTGIGAGISFETKPGIFTINYALGKINSDPFLFRAGKVHFGFVNYF